MFARSRPIFIWAVFDLSRRIWFAENSGRFCWLKSQIAMSPTAQAISNPVSSDAEETATPFSHHPAIVTGRLIEPADPIGLRQADKWNDQESGRLRSGTCWKKRGSQYSASPITSTFAIRIPALAESCCHNAAPRFLNPGFRAASTMCRVYRRNRLQQSTLLLPLALSTC